jgi:hypothetical protein
MIVQTPKYYGVAEKLGKLGKSQLFLTSSWYGLKLANIG